MDFFELCCIIYYSYKGNFVLFQMMPYTCSYNYWFKIYMPICNFKLAPTWKTVNMLGPLRVKDQILRYVVYTPYLLLLSNILKSICEVAFKPFKNITSDAVFVFFLFHNLLVSLVVCYGKQYRML